ncbi:hypothetical protein NEOLEDRAFT_1129163 [Neolentinus lepideus HHB14362 ss-1]|uniref:Cep57 centrosome microtubule-binding domain-containing protein n=1 Tax=Neolentinus lepideus HHB14362 ss-1 TaxID=1314782 RepID=A0A165UYU2_9AGAM|nr:hypothetical protein NEOLEDRAFT_1129163 [Neolentinus lepideus HHB14362 ss-1]
MRRATEHLSFSIRGDEQEHHRILLENNLQHTDLSLHLSSTPGDASDDYSVEYPRHHSGPSPSDGYMSFRSRDADDFDPGAWSYPTADEEGISPYGGETISTAAHHASALTLSAGLPGRETRRDPSISGTEYDPDRPIGDMIAALDSKMSLFDVDPSRSRSRNATSAFDPLVVDDTAELDQMLSPTNNTTSHSKPKLADHLSRLAFSPKRPRSALSSTSSSDRPHSQHKSHHAHSPHTTNPARPRSTQLQAQLPVPDSPSPADRTPRPSNARTAKAATPSPAISNKSHFTRLARGLAKEIADEQSRVAPSQQDAVHLPNVPTYNHSTIHDKRSKKSGLPEHIDPRRNPFRDMANVPPRSPAGGFKPLSPPPARVSMYTPPSQRSGVHLPDVTGLTSAVASPAKPGAQYYAYEPDEGATKEAEARLVTVLNTLQSKLLRLEDENGVSRRRVRELEMELESCKREATVVKEREESFRLQRKGKAKEREGREEDTGRYKEIAEEKKALESLISTLRAHLTRLTSELSSHQALLTELRSLRIKDTGEVERLREEVERVAGEVEVLRGVVEEGLRERRERREESVLESDEGRAMGSQGGEDMDESIAYGQGGVHDSLSYITLPQTGAVREALSNVTEERTEDVERAEESDQFVSREEVEEEIGEEAEEEDRVETEPEDEQEQEYPSLAHRTDRATLGSVEGSSRRFVRPREIERISEDLDSRRLERTASPISFSGSRSRSNFSHSNSQSRPATPGPSRSPSGDRSRDSGIGEEITSAGSGSGGCRRSYSPVQPAIEDSVRVPGPSRPTAPTPGRARFMQTKRSPVEETPFPTIRGEYLERLFFSAPEHNAKTCTVCNRRRSPGSPTLRFRAHAQARAERCEDEGFEEDADDERVRFDRRRGKQRSKEGAREELPPQTVLARVVRELEDDFTHYKGIYIELAEQYAQMDAVSDVVKRNVLADHLRDVIDILEQKGDQIASLYGLLDFKDKPLTSEPMAGENRPRKKRQHPTFA